MGFVDVMQGAISQAADVRIVLFPGDVIVSFIQQLHGAMESANPIQARIDRRVSVEILAVVDGGALDFVYGFVDFADGVLFFLIHVMGRRHAFQVSAGGAQIGKGVQVCGMDSRFLGDA
jgi:hypothetical protein